MRIYAACTAAVLWTAYFLVQRVSYNIRWPFDLWVGTVGVSTICAVLLSVLILPSLRPPVAWGRATQEPSIALPNEPLTHNHPPALEIEPSGNA